MMAVTSELLSDRKSHYQGNLQAIKSDRARKSVRRRPVAMGVARDKRRAWEKQNREFISLNSEHQTDVSGKHVQLHTEVPCMDAPGLPSCHSMMVRR